MSGPAKLQFESANGLTIDFLSGNLNLTGHTGFEGPNVRHRVLESPLRDGERYLNSRYRALFPVITFDIEGADYANLMANRRAVIRALAPKAGVGVLKYQRAAGADEYHIDALVERRAHSGNPRYRVAFESWTVQFRCPHPFWRSATDTDTNIAVEPGGMSVPLDIPLSVTGLEGSATIANDGDTESWPTLTVTPSGASITSPTIENQTTGKSLSLSGLTVADGETLEIDMLQQTAKVDGSSVLSKLTATSEFWSLATGNNTVRITHTDGDATWTVSHYSFFEGV